MGKALSKNPAALLFVLLFILFASVILGDNISDSLFLTHFDPSALPWMFMINAAFLFVISLNFITLIDRLDRGSLMKGVLIIHLLVLLIIRFLVEIKFKYVFPFLYSYAYSAKMIVFLTFWTMANDIISAREAKTSFPRIASGGVLGGILISFSVVVIIKKIPTEDLILVWGGLILMALPLVHVVHRSYLPYLKSATHIPSGKSRLAQRLEDFSLIRNEALLRNMAVIYFLTFLLLFAHDYIFLSTLKETFISAKSYFLSKADSGTIFSAISGQDTTKLILKKEIPTFLGLFKGIGNSITTLLQLTLAGFVLKRMGTVRSTLVMPVLFFLTYSLILLSLLGYLPSSGPAGYPFFGNLLFFIVLSSIALRIAVFDSIYSPNFQIFFSALKKEIRGRGKIFIEGIVKPFAILSAGLIIVMLFKRSYVLSVSILLGISALLLYLCFSIRKSYSESISRTLSGGKTDRLQRLMSSKLEGESPEVLDILEDVIDDPDPEVWDFAVTSLARTGSEKGFEILSAKFDRSGDSDKARMVILLSELKENRFFPIFAKGIETGSVAVLGPCIMAIHLLDVYDKEKRLLPLLNHPEVAIQVRVIVALWTLAEPIRQKDFVRQLESILKSGKMGAREAVLFALSEITDERLWVIMKQTLSGLTCAIKDTDASLHPLWIRALAGFEKEEAGTHLLRLAEVLHVRHLSIVESALLTNLLHHEKLLISALSDPADSVRRLAVRVLLKAKSQLTVNLRQAVADSVENEIKRLYKLSLFCAVLNARHPEDEVVEVLIGTIRENVIKRHLGHIVNLFSLLHPTEILSAVPDKITSESRHIRSNALELLENNVTHRHLKHFLLLCEDSDHETLQGISKSVWNFSVPDIYFTLSALFGETDKWVRALTLFTAHRLEERTGRQEYLSALNIAKPEVVSVLEGLLYA